MMRWNITLYVTLIIIALGVVTAQHKARKLYSKSERLQAVAAEYETEYEQLQIEQSTWATHSRVEKMATKQLKMEVPNPNQIQVIVMDGVGQ
ncbi:MAG: cell division protein FtsL [Methylophilaceae bacterium]|jgi:cell division protein FtsL